MLSRVAERIYWQARYLERTENTARLLDVFSNLLMDLPRGTKLGWHTLVEITGTHKQFDATGRQPVERNVMKFLLNEDNGMSIINMLAAARENARTTREIMPTEAFEQINELYYYARDNLGKGISRGPRHELFEEIITSCQQLTGLMAGTMSHNDAYSFVRLGRNLERADMTTRIVDVGSGNLLAMNPSTGQTDDPFSNILWMNILRSISAYQMYRQHVKDRINAEDVVIFLIQDDEFPRAVGHCILQLSNVIDDLPNHGKALDQIGKAYRMIKRANIEKLLNDGLFQFIDDLQVEIAEIHQVISKTWFLPR
jgi:uncharacterized alpha-E superfamily protein